MEDSKVSLREHLSEKIDLMERHLGARIADSERHLTSKIESVASEARTANNVAKEAVAKAEDATERRLEGLNELRSVVQDYQRTLLPRIEAEQRFGTIEDRIQKMEDAEVKQTGRTVGLAAGWAYLIAAVGLIVMVVSIYAATQR